MAAAKGNKYAQGLTTSGRPTAYRPEYADLAYKYCLLGATDADMAKFFEVSEATITNWKAENKEFLASIKAGREEADSNVANRLYTRATGYEYKEVTFEKITLDPDKDNDNEGGDVWRKRITVKQQAPDTTAAIFWLKNRQKDKWRDKTETDITSKGNQIGGLNELTDDELLRIINERNKG